MKTSIPAVLIAFALACFALVQNTQAVSPPPDGGYPGGNTAEGQNALFSLTSGGYNTAVGFFSLRGDSTGGFNTAIGAGTLLANTGNQNTAAGVGALFSNTIGSENTGIGSFALANNTTANANTALGYQALFSSTTGTFHTAIGYQALYSNVSDPALEPNTAVGFQALYSNTTGGWNTAIGSETLFHNTTDNDNTAIGELVLTNLTTGAGNTAIGGTASINHITGNQNIVLGYCAGQNLTTGGVNIYISNPGVPAENTTIRIGNVVPWTDIYGFGHPAHTATYIAGISGQTASGGVAVYINSDGKLGTLTSSARFKQDIRRMDQMSEAILALKPVTFRYKKEIDPAGTPQFGLVAEEVEKVNPDLVVRDEKGRPYSVRYEQVNAMLLNEFLKEHREVQEQKATIAQLKSTVESQEAANARQQRQVEALTAGLQKVSAQLESNKPTPQVVANDQ